MSKLGISKLKTLKLLDFFFLETDEDHVFSASEICAALEKEGIQVERKAIYNDIEALQSYGIDIVQTRSPKRGYFLASRKFEAAEIRLLIDAVQAATFISPHKSDLLIGKVASCAGKHQEEMMLRQVYADRRNKSGNEEIYYTIDELHRAIDAGRQVKFQYIYKAVSDDLKICQTERSFVVNPYALIWSNDHYYLVCNNPKYNNLMHTRLDKMKKVSVLESKARHFSEVSPYTDFFDSADYSGRLFNMYSGIETTVILLCRNELIEDIFDRFGSELPVVARTADSFSVKVKAVASDGFISWVMQFGGDIEVVSPPEVRNAVAEKAKTIADIYNGR